MHKLSHMSRDQRSRLALVVLLAVFLIPVATSSLRGLTHVLACAQETSSKLSLVNQESQEPVLLSAASATRGEPTLLCGGLSVNIAAQVAGPGQVTLIVPIENHSDLTWRGTVRLELDGTAVPLAIGNIPAGATVEDRVTVHLSEGQQEVSGELLIGP
jgi:hypothetical protein